ncbi:MAG TPA: carbonic anhydrase [Oligoflexia bacterium]|nr:carbonic anhydrase [Oligoflexia bacterium]HMR24619.1 carbonic anhydrase [Oligoflexia bacterium]
MNSKSKKDLEAITPKKALDILLEGNKRFSREVGFDYAVKDRINATQNAQYPFAVILTCMDSRVSTEIVFDQNIGDIFVIRVAGCVINEDILGSIEYACGVVGSKLVLVLGHTKCGAVTGACQDIDLGHLTGLLSKIKPAVNTVKNQGITQEDEIVEAVNVENVKNSIIDIETRSSILKGLINKDELKIQGAVYDVSTGKVHLLHKNE